MLRERRIPGDDRRCADKVQPGSRQRRQMQRLADVAGTVGSLGVPVGQRRTEREVQQHAAGYQSECAVESTSPEDGCSRMHLSTLYLSTFDGGKSHLVAKKVI